MPVLSHSTKYDGSLHYRIPAQVIETTPTRLASYRGPGSPIESYRGNWEGKWHVLGLHWSERHWNLYVHWEQDWTPRELYVNVATPARWDDVALRWIDLDLDLILPAGTSEPKLDDIDEFDLHRRRLGYPADLVESCLAAAVEVAALMRRRTPLFDGRLFDWRPGQPVPV
jgi:protein associated with RNAse G/E